MNVRASMAAYACVLKMCTNKLLEGITFNFHSVCTAIAIRSMR